MLFRMVYTSGPIFLPFCHKKTVTLPGSLLCPGTQIDNTFKPKKVAADKRAYFSSLAHNFITHQGGTEETVPGRNRSFNGRPLIETESSR